MVMLHKLQTFDELNTCVWELGQGFAKFLERELFGRMGLQVSVPPIEWARVLLAEEPTVTIEQYFDARSALMLAG